METMEVSKAPAISFGDQMWATEAVNVASVSSGPAGRVAGQRLRIRANAWAVAGTHWLAGGDLMRPVMANLIASGQDQIVASEPETGIFGAGETPSAALTDLRIALREHLDALEESSALTSDLARHRDFLRQHLWSA